MSATAGRTRSSISTTQANVDCLVCHDTTGKYRKLPGLAGHPPYKDMEFPPKSGKIVKAADLKTVAQNVGKTSRATCGACHFYGGGGDAVKHGDLDSSLINPGKYLDVHMAKDGLNFSCGTCHATSSHDVPGSRYAPTAMPAKGAQMRGKVEAHANPATCEACHGEPTAPARSRAGQAQRPHRQARLPDLPHPAVRARQCGHQAAVGLVDRRQAGREGQADHHARTATSGPLYDSKKGDFALRESHRFRNTSGSTARSTTRCAATSSTRRRSSRSTASRAARRRQVQDLAGQGVPRQAAVRQGDDVAADPAYLRHRRGRLLDALRLGEGAGGRHEGGRRQVQRRVRLRGDRR
jgi:hypothetical protein